MNNKETKRETDADAAPALDQRGNTPPAPVDVRKPLGKLISLRIRDWARVKALYGDRTSIILPPNPEAIPLALKGLLESVLAETGCITLAEVLRKSNLDLIVTADIVIPRTGEFRIDVEKQLGDIIEELLLHHMAAEASAVQEYGYWTIPLANVALALVPCDSDPVDYQTGHLVLETPLSDIRRRVEEAQSAREAIDAKRMTWVREQAEPLLLELHGKLSEATFPDSFRAEANDLRERLYRDSYFLQEATPSELTAALKNADWHAALGAIRAHVVVASALLRPLVQQFLDAVAEAKKSNSDLFPTVEQKRQFALDLQTVLDRVGLRLCCPKCSEPAILIVNDDVPEGRFRFLHGNRKRHHSSKHVPPLVLIEQPPSRRRIDE